MNFGCVKVFGASMLCLQLAACGQGSNLSNIEVDITRQSQRYDVAQAIAANSQVVVVGTQNGAVLVSGDQGRNWRRKVLGHASLIDIATCGESGFVAVDYYRKVWFAGRDGNDWRPHEVERPRTPLAVACDDDGGWWVAGVNSVIAGSRDQGKTWSITDLGEDTQITTIQFIDSQNAVAFGEFGLMVTTADGGRTWSKGPTIPGDFYPYAAIFRDRNEGWVSGLAGQVVHTRDGGQTWSKQANETAASLNRIFLHKGVPYGVGNGGVLARLDGDVWRTVPYTDALPMFLGGGASLPNHPAVVIGGPRGLLRTVSVANNPVSVANNQ